MAPFIPLILTDLLDRAATVWPGKGLGFVTPHHPVRFYTFPELKQRSLAILAGIQAKGLSSGERVMVALDSAEEIIPVLWACLYGGMIPALLQPPVSFTSLNPSAEKASRVYLILDGPHVIISHRHVTSWHESRVHPQQLIDFRDLNADPSKAVLRTGDPNDLAILQFSSGSTGEPKGVMLSHANILVNISAIVKSIHLTSSDTAVNWMPLYHDMGLIGFHFTPVLAGVNQYFLNPADFVKNPFLWLDTMNDHGCTITACPNFGQTIVNRRLARRTGKNWDLSPLRIVFNGAEPISASTMRTFLKGLEPYGLRPEAMYPAYGLAEATLAVSLPEPGLPPHSRLFDRELLTKKGIAFPVDVDTPGAIELVGVGSRVDGCEIMVADNRGKPVPEGTVGIILVSGRQVSSGYFANPDATRHVFTGKWLRTGDLGFYLDGVFYITGRFKDVIFINGMNFYAHDIEQVAQQMEGMEDGKVVVSGIFDDKEGRDRLLVFLTGAEGEDGQTRCQQLKHHLINQIGISPDYFVPVRSADIERTSSGKIRRFKLAERFRNGEFSRVWMI